MSNSVIKSIKAREILDSRGNPTLEVECITDNGIFVDSVPSGASTGQREALELRDGGDRFGGKGVLTAVKNVNEIIAPKLMWLDAYDQNKIDNILIELDGTENKSRLGANAILGVSMCVCRAGATFNKQPLYKHIADVAQNRKKLFIPQACFNVINGGAHAGNELDFQEFMIVPDGESFAENLRMASETYYKLKKIIKQNYSSFAINIGDEGGFAPPIDYPEVALGIIDKAIEAAGYAGKIKINLDVAATNFKDGGDYYKTKMGVFSRDDLLSYYETLISNHAIIGLEDPFAENDWQGFVGATENFGKKIMIIGDDLLTTNSKYIKEAREKKACNAVLLKLNQIGTVTELINAAKLSQKYEWKNMVSHRSGETTDDFIADLAVGIGAEFIKSGAPARGERLAKYNRLLKIETEIYSAE
jgi:enolase